MKEVFWLIRAKSFENDDYVRKIENNLNRSHYSVPWWGKVSLSEEVSRQEKCRIFIANSNRETLPDVLWNGGSIDIFSIRMLPIMDAFHVQYEVFSPVFVSSNTSEILNLPYIIFRLLDVKDAIDHELSIIEEKKIGGVLFPSIKKLVIKQNLNSHFFRLKGFENYQMISNSLKLELENETVTGLEFIRDDEFQSAAYQLLSRR